MTGILSADAAIDPKMFGLGVKPRNAAGRTRRSAWM
jgi:hypothetical protein